MRAEEKRRCVVLCPGASPGEEAMAAFQGSENQKYTEANGNSLKRLS